MTNNQIIQLKLEIDSIKEYINTDVCKKCEEMYNRLHECQKLLENLQDEANQSKTTI